MWGRESAGGDCLAGASGSGQSGLDQPLHEAVRVVRQSIDFTPRPADKPDAGGSDGVLAPFLPFQSLP